MNATLRRTLFIVPTTLVYATPILFVGINITCDQILRQAYLFDVDTARVLFGISFIAQTWLAVCCFVWVRSEPVFVRLALLGFALQAILFGILLTRATAFE